MRKVPLAAGLALLLAVLLSSGALATDIFVWQHDNGRTVRDPVFNQVYTATQALTQTLDELDLDCTIDRSLPEDLSDYDLVMTCLSWYCPG